MYWELSGDYVGSGSMVAAVNSVLGALDTTQNHLLYPGSQFLNMQTCMGESRSPLNCAPRTHSLIAKKRRLHYDHPAGVDDELEGFVDQHDFD